MEKPAPSITFVCGSGKLHEAIANYKNTLSRGQVPQIIATFSLTEFFLNYNHRLLYFPVTNLYSFQLDTFIEQYRNWSRSEIKRVPERQTVIEEVEDIVIQLFKSTWPIDNDLVVRELLSGDEVFADYP